MGRVLALLVVLLLATAAASPFLNMFSSMLRGGQLPIKSAAAAAAARQPGGTTCAGCAIVLTLVDSAAVFFDNSVGEEVDRLCKRLPLLLREPCVDFVAEFGTTIIEMLEARESPDAVCAAIHLCPLANGAPVCRLQPTVADAQREKERIAVGARQQQRRSRRFARSRQQRSKMLESPWRWFYDKLETTFNSHVPLVDDDNDTFSTAPEFRGYSWRGRDCDDHNAGIRPGTKFDPNSDPNIDWNCNGIYGIDPASGLPWEEELCANTQPYGIVQLGDSASAHFHIPPSYMNVTQVRKKWRDKQVADTHVANSQWADNTFANLVEILANEFDWPQMSTTTGWQNSTWAGAPPKSPMGSYSIYQQVLERNACVHRDYQSISVNGARSSSMAQNIIFSFRRNPNKDIPVLAGFALIGNDVCNGHEGFSHYTTVAEFTGARCVCVCE